MSFVIGRGIPEAEEIHPVRGGKWVSGGNLSINLRSEFADTVPPYYTPHGSRGDDTIFSLQLSRAKVMNVPSGAFHDMYLDYIAITRGEFPTHPGYLPESMGKYVVRFADGIKAWLAYAPLFIRLTGGAAYQTILKEMLVKLRTVDRTLFLEFPLLGEALNGRKLADILSNYARRVDTQYQELQLCRDAWHRVCTQVRQNWLTQS
jgi:hypothetical protein